MQPEPKMLQSMPFPVSVYVPDTKLREAEEKQTNKNHKPLSSALKKATHSGQFRPVKGCVSLQRTRTQSRFSKCSNATSQRTDF